MEGNRLDAVLNSAECMLIGVSSTFVARELMIDRVFQGNRVHASGKWSSTTGAPPRAVHLEEIKNRLTPIGLDGMYFLPPLMQPFSCVDSAQACTRRPPSRDLARPSRG